MNDDLHVQPSIAKSWEISDSGMTYTFHLRDDVFFHANECFENEEIEQLLKSSKINNIQVIDLEKGIENTNFITSTRHDYWRTFLLIALGLLVLEILIIKLFKD